jgi:hypothetical protein
MTPRRKGADQRLGPGGGDLEHPASLGQHDSRLAQHLRATAGHDGTARATLEHLDADRLLHLADLGGEGGLADGAGLGGAAEAEMLADRHQVFEGRAARRPGGSSAHLPFRRRIVAVGPDDYRDG